MGMGGGQWGRFGMGRKVIPKLFWVAGTHICGDVRGASR